MSQGSPLNLSEIPNIGLAELKKRWGWFVAFGFLLVIIGTFAIGATFMMTLITMVFMGWLLMITGVLEFFHAFTCKKWKGVLIDVFVGILYLAVGGYLVGNPGASAVALTLPIALFLIFGGIFRIVASLMTRYKNWGWLFFNGLISLLLGISVLSQWPYSGMWVIGLFVGIDILFNGWSLIMLGISAKNLPLGDTADDSGSSEESSTDSDADKS